MNIRDSNTMAATCGRAGTDQSSYAPPTCAIDHAAVSSGAQMKVPEFKTGDSVLVEVNGQLMFPTPVPIEEVYEHEEKRWYRVQGSTTGLTADNLTLVSPNKTDIAAHLYALFPPAFVKDFPDAWIEIAYADSETGALDAAENFSAFDIQAAAEFAEKKNEAGHNVYVGAALRHGERCGRARGANVLTASHAWAEFDQRGDAERIDAVLEKKNLQRAIIVVTGTTPHLRAHLYFKLADRVSSDELKAANTALKTLLGSDAVENADRVMRLAGTINYPTKKKRERGYVPELVRLQLRPDAPTYTADNLIGLADKPSSAFGFDIKAGRDDSELKALLEDSRVPGRWHNSMRAAIATMIGRGWSDSAIKLACAAYCRGGADDPDLVPLIEGGRRKWDKPNEEPAGDVKHRQAEAGESSVAYVANVAAWPLLDNAAYHGLAGEVVHKFEPHTEADPVAILVQVLTLFGNVIGSSAHFRVEADNHRANLFAVLVGQSSKGRKGVSGGRARSVVSAADQSWVENRMRSGLSSGEGLINEVRDEVKKWDAKAHAFEVVDPGATDKRLMVTEPEFANALAVMERHGNTLSPVIRNAWDGVTLSTLTKNNPLRATNPHISIIAHITDTELRGGITRVDACNGFANRFLFLCVRRSKFLPFGGSITDAEIAALADKIKDVAEIAKRIGRVNFTPRAREAWAAVYSELSKEQPGLLGAVTARSEAQALRLALVYALLDGRSDIDIPHLEAALAVWNYAEASAAYIFGESLGDPVADEILRALQQAGANGMTRTAIRDLFGRHKSGERIGAALALLLTKGRAWMDQTGSGGRPTETWFAKKG